MGVDDDDNSDSGIEPVSSQLSKAKVDNVDQCFLFVVEFTLLNNSNLLFSCAF